MTVVLFYAERIIVFGERTFYQLTEIYTSMFKNPGLKRRTRRITLSGSSASPESNPMVACEKTEEPGIHCICGKLDRR